jgi:tetratricopeptide (TPR) repeat protein
MTAQLIDAIAGSQAWAERYDRALEDVFQVQEELTRAIVGALVPQIDLAETSRSLRTRPANVEIGELIYQGFAQMGDGYKKADGALLDAAIESARKALALDPANSYPWAIICATLNVRLLLGQAMHVEQVRSDAFAAGTKAIELDPQNNTAFTIRGTFQCHNGRFGAGLQDMRHAHALNPNDALTLYQLGFMEALNGDASCGAELIRQAIRLSPKDFWRPVMHQCLSFAFFLERQYFEGVKAALVATNEAPSMASAYVSLALNYVGLADISRARETVDKVHQINPTLIDLRLKTGWPCQRAEDAERLMVFLRVAAGHGSPCAADGVR